MWVRQLVVDPGMDLSEDLQKGPFWGLEGSNLGSQTPDPGSRPPDPRSGVPGLCIKTHGFKAKPYHARARRYIV